MIRLKTEIGRKLNSKKGFSLTELLLAMLIMLMVSAIMVAGIPAAREAYQDVVIASNADLMLSTTISTLRNELGSAKDVKAESDVVTYINITRGAASKIYKNASATQEIMLDRYATSTVIENSGSDVVQSMTLSSTPANNDLNLYVTYSSVECANGIITFHGLQVNSDTGKTDLAGVEAFSIRLLSEN